MPTTGALNIKFKPLPRRELQFEKNIKAGYLQVDFATAVTQDVDFTIPEQQGNLASVLGLFIDNSTNSFAISVKMRSTSQVITLPPFSQAYLPVYSYPPAILQFTCANPVIVPMQVLNFHPEPQVWLCTTPSVTVTPTKSSTCTRSSVPGAAASTNILALNANRLGASIYNDSAAILYLDTSGGVASVANYTVQLGPNGYFEVPAIYTGLITGIWASATGAAKVAEYT